MNYIKFYTLACFISKNGMAHRITVKYHTQNVKMAFDCQNLHTKIILYKLLCHSESSSKKANARRDITADKHVLLFCLYITMLYSICSH